jgi:hypothetical protein
MNESPRISPLPPDLRSQDFEFLRAEGLAVIQALAAESWTDHNLHDPGITLLEAACYAVTEAGLRAGMELEDLLASSAAYARPELFTAARLLPVAPVTAADLRKVLLDHPLLNNAWLFPLQPVPLGRMSALLEFADDTLNSNIFVVEVTPAGAPAPYRVALAFPHWDDEDVLPLREDVTLQSVVLSGPPGDEWNNIEGSASYFTRATVSFGGPQPLELWVVAQVLTGMEDSAAETPPVLQELVALLGDLSESGPLKRLNRRVIRAFEAMRVVRRYALTYRNLCEDLVEFNAVRLQEVGVSAIVEIGSGVAAEELLAEIFFRIDALIAPPVHFRSLDEQLLRLGSADVVFDGPLPDSGFLDNAELGARQITHTLYTSDILRLIYQIRGADDTDVEQREDVNARRIIAVRSLSLSNYIDNRPITTRARDCLRLVRSQRHVPRLSIEKSRIVLYRNGIEIAYDAARVAELFAGKKAAGAQSSTPLSADVAVRPGEAFPIGDFYPIQNDLPTVYGVGEAGLPEHVPAARRAQARQLKGYLFYFEQLVAGYHAQLARFNAFFSADPALEQTLFQQPLYHLPDIAPLFVAFDPQATTWPAFQGDDTHAYAEVLRDAVESREQFLDRRNAVLDHLLATLGEDMRDRVALVFRLAAEVPGGAALPLPLLLAIQRQRRLDALRDLIRDKSDYYYDVPELNRTRAQAHGHPLRRTARLAEVTPVAGGSGWRIVDRSGAPLLRHVAPAASPRGAQRAMEEALQLATRAGRYTVRTEVGGERRLELRSNAAADPVAESVDSYPTDADAQAAIPAAVDAALDLWASFALVPLEWRLHHLLGIDLRERRRLVHAVADYVEIFDAPVNPNNEKLFRLWESPGLAGDELLVSVDVYPGATDAAATASALAAAALMLEHGGKDGRYRIEDAGPNTFEVVLTLPDGTALARSPLPAASEAAAVAAAGRIRDHLYGRFSGEGCHLVEHHLLFPTAAGTALEVPGRQDPYSFQLTLVLPSGYARDLSQENGAREPAPPALYRSEEFRRYAERQIRNVCPAHILPRVLWLDRALPGTPVGAADASLDAFEEAYFAWLSAYLADEAGDTEVGAPRTALTAVMNALYQEYYTT